MWLDVELLQEHSSRKMDGEVTPGLLRQEDVRPGCGAGSAVWRRGLQEDLCWLCCGAAGCDGACKRTSSSFRMRAELVVVGKLATDKGGVSEKTPRGAKLWSPSVLSGSEVITLAFRFPSAAFPGPESKNFMMVDTMLRAVFTMALVLVTMLLQINCTPPG